MLREFQVEIANELMSAGLNGNEAKTYVMNRTDDELAVTYRIMWLLDEHISDLMDEGKIASDAISQALDCLAKINHEDTEGQEFVKQHPTIADALIKAFLASSWYQTHLQQDHQARQAKSISNTRTHAEMMENYRMTDNLVLPASTASNATPSIAGHATDNSSTAFYLLVGLSLSALVLYLASPYLTAAQTVFNKTSNWLPGFHKKKTDDISEEQQSLVVEVTPGGP